MREGGRAFDDDTPPPPRPLAVDKPPQPLAFLVRPPEKGLSIFSRSDSSIREGFFVYLGCRPRIFREISVLLISGGILCPNFYL